ncbi:BIG/ATPase V1 complex, subunit S1 [Cryomyces antarcticus]
MRYSCLGALALSFASVQAFRDTSPFFLFSTSELVPTILEHTQAATSGRLASQISQALSECPSDTYILVSQPGVSAADFAGASSTPHLRKYIERENFSVVSSVAVPDVVGALDTSAISKFLETDCKASPMSVDTFNGYITMDDVFPRVVRVDFPVPPVSGKDRALKLAQHDSFLNALVAGLRRQTYTVIYITTPPSDSHNTAPQHAPQVYEMDEPFPSGLHTDLKRDLTGYASSSNSTNLNSNLPLFEKYQFLSSGTFMGLFVGLLLLLVLYVAISAVSSLEVSYAAFSKEMGPSAQRKQQ